jgi:hypothetical protein
LEGKKLQYYDILPVRFNPGLGTWAWSREGRRLALYSLSHILGDSLNHNWLAVKLEPLSFKS